MLPTCDHVRRFGFGFMCRLTKGHTSKHAWYVAGRAWETLFTWQDGD